MHQAGVPLDLIRWLGRWGTMRTVEIYIQEVAALSALQNLPVSARARIAVFADRAAALLHHVVPRTLARGYVAAKEPERVG